MPWPPRKPAGPAMAAAQAQLTSAELDLGYTRVTSPITGLAGNRQVDVGSYVGSPEPTVLTVVSALDPVRFDFTISEAEYLAYARATKAQAGKRSGAGPELELVLADGSVHSQKGRVTVVGRGVDAETGTLPLQATFPNPGGLLRPGQFGRVRLPVTTRKDAIVIPQRAVQELQGTYNVFVVGSDSVGTDPRHQAREPESAAIGSSPRASSPPTGSWSRACRRCATAPRYVPPRPRPRRQTPPPERDPWLISSSGGPSSPSSRRSSSRCSAWRCSSACPSSSIPSCRRRPSGSKPPTRARPRRWSSSRWPRRSSSRSTAWTT